LQVADRISFEGRAASYREFWAKCQYLGAASLNSHPEWQVYQAVSAFAQTPTQSNLAEQLSAISHLDLDWGLEMSWLFPWQIEVCLTARESGYPWSEIISSVVAGRLGTERDWLRWEGQNEKGVPLSRFRVADALSITDDRQGLLFRKSGWSFGAIEDQIIRLAAELSVALDQFPDIRSHERLLQVSAFLLNKKISEPSSIEFQSTLAQFVGVCAEHKVAITTELVNAILQSGLTPWESGSMSYQRRLAG
jgi:hypothetical protein